MSMLSRLRPPQARATSDDGVAIIMVLAYILILTSLMLAMLAIVIGQVKPIAQARKAVGSVNAASSGLQAALTAMRTATDTLADNTAGAGNRGRLPCTPGATTRFTDSSGTHSTPGARTKGVASSLPGHFQYEYNVAYFVLDPTDKAPSWLATNAMTCPLVKTPLYAYIQSYGVGGAVVSGTAALGNRSQSGVYKFSVPTENIAGGQIRPRSNHALCYDAGTTPDVGSRLTLQPCADPVQPQQLFVYRTDLTLFYGGNPALNLCIEASSKEVPNLQRCAGVGSGNTFPYSDGQQVQSWSYNDGGSFAAGNNNGNVDSKCLAPAAVSAGSKIVLGGCSATDPDPSVGAGKAGGNTTGRPGAPTNQFVNFDQFGRCLDVTNYKFTEKFLIAYPCKQAPDSGLLSWNQLWQFKAVSGNVGKLYTNPNDTRVEPANFKDRQVCLTADPSTQYVQGTVCQSPLPPQQQFTATGTVPGSPQTSYTMVSKSLGTCLSLSPSTDVYSGSIRKITLETCNGSPRQRWNAPPPPPASGLDDIREGTPITGFN